MMVTHDQEEAMTMADRLAVMSEGKLVQVGTPSEIYEFPNSRFSAEFIGSTNMFEGALISDDSNLMESPELSSPLELLHKINGVAGKPLCVSIRPEQISMSHKPSAQKQNIATGIVEQIAYMGSYSQFYIRLESKKLVLVSTSRLEAQHMEKMPSYDDQVYLSWEPNSCVVLN
jgi:putrescine transport system ATP-binding protein